MNEDYTFFNEGLTCAIKDYLQSKENKESPLYNSFLVVCIRLLASIYDELDIINPYVMQNEKMFINNICKYGYNENDVLFFLSYIQNYYQEENEDGFIFIQKMLIDMFMKKKKNIDVTKKEIGDFSKLLYSPKSISPLMISTNYLMTASPLEVINYFESELENNIHIKNHKEKEILNLDAYKILNYSEKEIESMPYESLEKLNKKVYNFFEVKPESINKDYQLEKKVYEYLNPKTPLTTGNGYVDVLYILSIIATLGMIIVIITLLIK